MAKSYDFEHAPGHLIRRAHQRAVAVFMEETAAFDVTPVQFAILNALIDDPGEDQVTLAARVAFDAATSGSVIGRLEAKGWVRRQPDVQDRRRKLIWVTPEGEPWLERQIVQREGSCVMAKKPRWQVILKYLTRSSKDPESLARGVGLGRFVGLLPSVGFQVILALLTCWFS